MRVSTNPILNVKVFKDQKMIFKYLKEVFGKKDQTILGPGNIPHKVEEILDQGLEEDDLANKKILIINF